VFVGKDNAKVPRWSPFTIKVFKLRIVYNRYLASTNYHTQLVYFDLTTLYNVILRIARNLLKTSENIKIRPIHFTIQIWTDFHENEPKKKKSKWPIFQNGRFSKSPILKKISRKFHRLVLGLVRLIDVKGIDVAQPIWL
jgi:hypothetical protein